jgi:hypothetical protein
LLKGGLIPTNETNCLGMLSRETGHKRVPAPPHMITGVIWSELVMAVFRDDIIGFHTSN